MLRFPGSTQNPCQNWESSNLRRVEAFNASTSQRRCFDSSSFVSDVLWFGQIGPAPSRPLKYMRIKLKYCRRPSKLVSDGIKNANLIAHAQSGACPSDPIPTNHSAVLPKLRSRSMLNEKSKHSMLQLPGQCFSSSFGTDFACSRGKAESEEIEAFF